MPNKRVVMTSPHAESTCSVTESLRVPVCCVLYHFIFLFVSQALHGCLEFRRVDGARSIRVEQVERLLQLLDLLLAQTRTLVHLHTSTHTTHTTQPLSARIHTHTTHSTTLAT